ncbi:MAG: hypothetical protein ACXABY_34640 [Candidatus Thorarchaeota archaeon]
MEDAKNILTIIVLVCVIIGNAYAVWRFNNSFVKKKDFKPEDYIKASKCQACKGDMQVADKQVRDDIRNIKVAIVEEESRIKTLGVIQVVMCRHIGMKQEEIDVLRDAIMNGTDVTSLL